MNRREFLKASCAASALVVAGISSKPNQTIGVDMSNGDDQTVVFLSTPTGDDRWVHDMMMYQRKELSRVTGIPSAWL